MSMENNSQQKVSLASMNFSEVLSDGLKLFFKSYKTIILPLAFFHVLLMILNVLILTDLRLYNESLAIGVTEILENYTVTNTLTESEMNVIFYFFAMFWVTLFLQNLIGAIVISIAMCSISNYVYEKYTNESVSFIDSFKLAFNKKMLIPILIIGICLPVSSLILYFPAFILFGFYIFLVFTYNMKENENPFSEARAIAKGAFRKIIGIFIINLLIIVIISSIFTFCINALLDTILPTFNAIRNGWYNQETRNYGMIILLNLLYSLIDILFAPLFICLLTALFSNLKAKKELGIQYKTKDKPTFFS